MSDDQFIQTDVRDMYSVHEAFRRGLRDAGPQIAAVNGDAEGAARFSAYLCDLLELLHAHHDGEDELLYPLLVERVPSERALFDEMDAQHRGVTDAVNACLGANSSYAESASIEDGKALREACDALGAALEGHLNQEETDILPLAQVWITPEEWGQLPGHAMRSYQGSRLWMPLGLAIEAMPDDLRSRVASHLPPPVASMWFGGGADSFSTEMELIRALP
jgi:hemerythrin-like domain-containing protein